MNRCTLATLSLVLAAGLLTGMAGCSTVRVKDFGLRDTSAGRLIGAVGARPAPETVAWLQRKALEESWAAAPAKTAREVIETAKVEQKSDPERDLAAADMALDLGRRWSAGSPREALPWFLEAARLSRRVACASPEPGAAEKPEPPERLGDAAGKEVKGKPTLMARAVSVYHPAVAGVIRLSGRDGIWGRSQWFEVLANQGVEVRNVGGWSHRNFQAIWLAEDYIPRGVRHHYVAEGVGVAAIGMLPTDHQAWTRDTQDGYYADNFSAAVTALIVEDSDGKLAFELRDPLDQDVVEWEGRTLPMARDLTVPLALQFGNKWHNEVRWVGLFQPDRLEQKLGLRMFQPYHAQKIPVVFVHGLWSSHKVWLQALNELRADPELNSRFQFWYFVYPSGYPLPVSAMLLRDQLYAARRTFDPSGRHPAFDQMVLVGHSMGGIISKMQVADSGNILWNTVFTRPFEEVKGDSLEKEMLYKAFFFQANPAIKRVVFIATPHRGSALGNQFPGRTVSQIVRLPVSVLSVAKNLVRDNGPDIISEEIRNAGTFNSVDNLGLDNPLLSAISQMPLEPGVAFHSILGDRRPDEEGGAGEGGDGVVPYASGHFERAESELMIPGAGHGVQDTPAAVDEVKRILREHIAEVDAQIQMSAKIPAIEIGGIREHDGSEIIRE